MKTITIPIKYLKLLLSLVPYWAKEVPKGLDPTFYGTLSYEGDLDVKKKIDIICEALKTAEGE